MIIDEKWMHPPPPPYYRSPPPAFAEATGSGTSTRNASEKPTFSTLPAHLLLQIVYSTFPQRDGKYEGEGKIERQRRNLYWLETSLRLVNKSLYTACMHILRSTYLPAYDSLIRPPYTSDPFSSSLSPDSPSSSGPVHRELCTLDLFIALLAHEDILLDATSLHLPREEAYKDLFDMSQPRSRLEDLMMEEGVKAGLVYFGDSPPPPRLQEPELQPVPASQSNEPDKDLLAVQTAVANTSAASGSGSAQVSPSPTKLSFNPFSRSSYISLAKSKMRRASNSSPPSPSTPTPQPASHTIDAIDSMTPPASPLPSSSHSSTFASRQAQIKPLPFAALTVSFNPRRVGLVYTPAVSSNYGTYNGSTFGALSMSVTGPTAAGGMKAKKTLVEVQRARDERLEVSAKRLIVGLEEVLRAGEV